MAGLLELMDNLASIILLYFIGTAQHQLKDRFLFNFLCLALFLGGGFRGLVWLRFGLVYLYILQRRKIKKQPF